MTPEALLTWDSVRRLEQHTDIGPGGVTRLLIELNYRQHCYTLDLLRDAEGMVERGVAALGTWVNPKYPPAWALGAARVVLNAALNGGSAPIAAEATATNAPSAMSSNRRLNDE